MLCNSADTCTCMLDTLSLTVFFSYLSSAGEALLSGRQFLLERVS